MADDTRTLRAGPAWISLVRLDETGAVSGSYINLLYNEAVSAKFKGKIFEIPADNAPSALYTIGTGLETCSIEGLFKKYSLDQFNLFLGQNFDSVDGSIMDIHGTGTLQRVWIQVVFANFVKEPNLWSKIGAAAAVAAEGFDVVEFRLASVGGEEVEMTGAKEKERMLKLMAKAMSDIEIAPIPGKAQFGVPIADPRILKNPSPAGFLAPQLFAT